MLPTVATTTARLSAIANAIGANRSLGRALAKLIAAKVFGRGLVAV
jgi:hypothetical protein